MNQTTALSTPAEEVDTLIKQVADEYGLELAEKLSQPVPAGKVDSFFFCSKFCKTFLLKCM
jgi:division protein CdvB (Snf7/Vps24/ESCRT-III family)